MIYLDNNATTRLHPKALEAMMPFLTDCYANASSSYRPSRRARKAIDRAREQVAALIDASPDEIIFTSGGTEADNTAIASSVTALAEPKHIITSSVEHPAVANYFDRLEKRHSYQIHRLGVGSNGLFDLKELDSLLAANATALVSLMWANNETGVIFPIAEAAEIAAKHGAFFHSDAIQAIGKIPLSVREGNLHFLALSAHKLHGPKGVGALYANSRVRLHPYLLGGNQENDRRAGTENVAGIVGFGEAADQMRQELESGGHDRIRKSRDAFEDHLRTHLDGVEINGDPLLRLPNTSSLSFSDIEAQGLLILLDEAGICASAGSACHTGSLYPSEVLSAMGLSRERALGTVRFSFSHFTTTEEIEIALDHIVRSIKKLLDLRPRSRVSVVSRSRPATT